MQQHSESYLAQDRGDTLVGVCALLIVLETILLLLRVYARRLAHVSLGYDDAVLPLGWLANIGCNIVCINSVYNAGVGRHVQALAASDLSAWAKSVYALEVLYLTGAALPKLSIILFYLRIFVTPATKWACRALLVYTIAVWVTFFIASTVKCIPVAYMWNKEISGHCVDIVAYYKSSSAPNIVSDVVIAALPLPTLLRLHMSLGRKIGPVLVFLTGSIGLIGSCVRMSIFFRFDAFKDNTWVAVPLMAWTCVEPGMYLIAACLLALGPLLNRIPIKALRSKQGFSRGQDIKSPHHHPLEKSQTRRTHGTLTSDLTETHEDDLDSTATASATKSQMMHDSIVEVDLENDSRYASDKHHDVI